VCVCVERRQLGVEPISQVSDYVSNQVNARARKR